MTGGKKHRRSRGLFNRYITFFAIIEIISLLAFGFVLFYFVTDSWEDEQKQILFNYANQIADSYSDLVRSSDGDDKALQPGICYMVANMSSAAKADIFIADTNGSIIFCRHMTDMEDSERDIRNCPYHSKIKIPGEIVTGIIADGVMATRGNLSGVLDEECFVSAVVISSDNNGRQTSDGQTAGEPMGIVCALQTTEAGLRPYHIKFIRIYVLSALVLLVVISLITYVSTYNMTRPLKDMSEATKRYSDGDFSYRIKRNDGNVVTEFDELAAAVNSMADNLEKLENLRTEFVANVSHELKTPMTTIGGFIDGILDGTIAPEKEEHYLRIVSDEVKRLSRLIVSTLNISKMEAGELCIRPVTFNLTHQILSIFVSFEQKINLKEISVKGLDSLLNYYIEADPDMINQVFYNLIDNAVKFTDDGGEIAVDLDSDGEYVYFTIKNTGKGIDSEDIDHIFERFYKGDKSRSLDAKSSGLGLFIVKSIVELHSGEITARSTDNKYTVFTVKLKMRLSAHNFTHGNYS